MKIKPTDADLKAWANQVPKSGDLLFFDKISEPLASIISFPILSTEEVKAQSLDLWKLSDRSWYGYSLKKSKCVVYLPSGTLDTLDRKVREKLGRAQIQLGVPSLIKSSLLPASLRACLIRVGRFSWITSLAFRSLDQDSRLAVMKAWVSQNEIHFYSSIKIEKLPEGPRALIKTIGFENIVNSYAKISGPNCMATVAAAVAGNPKIANQWLHWAPLKTFLQARGYKIIRSNSPMPEDVLAFSKGKAAIHTAFYLGENLYLEKSGQDFYEPYRIERIDRWKLEWPKTKLSIWRRDAT